VLGISGELVWPVPPLALPDAYGVLPPVKVLRGYEAISLFIDRARLSQSPFELTNENAHAVAEICRQLDGLPLAIELAAARVRLLSPSQIAERLNDRFKLLTSGSRMGLPHHQTLRATMDWSYELLSEKEQRLWRGLSVFVHGWTLEAAEQICHDEKIEAPAVLELLGQLVDKSLVLVGQKSGLARYRMLETVKQYGAEKLHLVQEAEIALRKHAHYFMQTSESMESELKGRRQKQLLSFLEADLDNFRSALSWILEHQEIEMGFRLAGGAISRFWHVRGYFSEGLHWLEQLLTARYKTATPARAKTLTGAGSLAWVQGSYEKAIAFHEEGLALHRQFQNKQGMADAMNGLGSIMAHMGKNDEAYAYFQESLALRRELGDLYSVARSLGNLGAIADRRGDYATARALFEEGLAIQRKLDDKQGMAIVLVNLGVMLQNAKDFAKAQVVYEESLALRRELGDKHGIALALSNLGAVACKQEKYEIALSFYAEALRIHREIGGKPGMSYCLKGLADVSIGQKQLERSARLFGAEASLRESIGFRLRANDLEQYRQDLGIVQELLGRELFDRLQSEGRAMTLEEATEYALGETE
jgi:predicted ATPase/Tfp pilus assembly protein PilF